MSRLAVAILAGGLASRMGTLCSRVPKSLLEVAGRPFVYHQLALLRDRGIARVTLCVGHLGEMIVEAVGDGSSLGLEIVYSFDGTENKGTAGAIKQALPLLTNPFFVLYGDSYLECDYSAVQDAHAAAHKLALMTVFRNDGDWDKSNVEFHQNKIASYDKIDRTDRMRYIDYGLGVFDKDAFQGVPESGSYDLATLYRSLLGTGQLAGYEVRQRFYEIGSVAGLKETRTLLGERQGREVKNVGGGHDARSAVFSGSQAST